MASPIPSSSRGELGWGRSPLVSKLARSAIDLVFPIHCAGCGREGGIICGQCVDGLARLAQPYCRVCADPGISDLCRWCSQFPRGFDSLRSPFRLEGPLRDAIFRLKYKGERASAGPLANLMVGYLEHNPVPVEALVSAPLHPRRLRNRGYNQSMLLAREIGKRLNLPVREDLLIRISNPRPQVETQSQQERRSNLAGNFHCQGDATGMAVLLIDDVATTGSTLSECALALKSAGAARVHALTLAREA